MTVWVARCEDCTVHGKPLYLRQLHEPETERDRAAHSLRPVYARGLCNECWTKRQRQSAVAR